jgi:ubiquinone/menaquinone biosynthesis C-methylase UbiE
MISRMAFAFLFAFTFIVWRLASNRQSVPCPAWLSWLVELDNPLFRNNRASATIAGLQLQPGTSVLDVGCGPGRLVIPLARRIGPSGTVVVFDLQPEMLARAEAKANAAGLSNLVFRHGEICSAALDPGTFDRATLATVLDEIPDHRGALAKIFAVLKPGGVLAVTEVIADPHFQLRTHVLRSAQSVGFREARRTGNPISYTLYLEKPALPARV